MVVPQTSIFTPEKVNENFSDVELSRLNSFDWFISPLIVKDSIFLKEMNGLNSLHAVKIADDDLTRQMQWKHACMGGEKKVLC